MSNKFYAVRVGRVPGIYNDWKSTEQQINKFPGAIFKSFSTYGEAETFITGNVKPYQILQQVNYNLLIGYTDGSSVKNIGGYGVILIFPERPEIKDIIYNGRVPWTPCTNNQAELYAIFICLSSFINLLKERPTSTLTLRTDSKYAIQSLTEWIFSWKQNSWLTSKKNPVENINLIKSMDSLLE
jgi:ribonuclease HI